MLSELGLRYEAEGAGGYLSPVYKASDEEKKYEVVCATCIKNFEWAVAFRKEEWLKDRTTMYEVDTFRRF